jgi:hypothetical protein
MKKKQNGFQVPPFGIARLLFLFCGLFMVSGGAFSDNVDQDNPKQIIKLENQEWRRVLCKALMFYHQEKYNDAFSLLEKTINEKSPGPEAHRCIALMQKSFSRIHKLDAPIMKWTKSARVYIAALEAKKNKQEADLVILASIKELIVGKDGIRNVPSELTDLANRKDDKNSQWSDWAQWALMRHWCESFYVEKKNLGSMTINVGRRAFRVVLADGPIPLIKARLAKSLLRDKPGTYMGRELRFDLLNWRLSQLKKALNELASNEWMTNGKQKDEIVPFDKEIEKRLREIGKSYAETGQFIPKEYSLLVNSEIQLDNLLWRDGDKQSIPAYLRALVAVVGAENVPADVQQWFDKMPKGNSAAKSIGGTKLP